MMKKTFGILCLIFLCFIVGCNKDKAITFEIKEISGHTDATIDQENQTVSFSVDALTENFAVSDIILPEGILLTAYADSLYTEELGDTLSLEEGLNTFYLNLYYSEDDKQNSSWTLEITRLVDEIKAISVKDYKDTYYIGESLANSGVLTVTYQSGKQRDIDITPDMVSGFDSSKTGKLTLTITYNWLTTTFVITVVDEVTSLNLIDPQTKYLINSSFVPSEMEVVYISGKKETVTITSEMLSGFDTSTVGTKEVTVTYEGISTTYQIVVSEELRGIELNDDFKVTYDLGEEYQEGAYLTLHFDSGSEDIILTKDMISGFDTSHTGRQMITISYNGFTIETYIVVQSSYYGDDFVMPEKTSLDMATIKEIFENFDIVLCMFERAIGYDEAVEYLDKNPDHYLYYEVNFDKVKEVLETAGVKEDDLDFALSVLKDDLIEMLEAFSNKEKDRYDILKEDIFIEENIVRLQQIIEEIMIRLSPEQVSVILVEAGLFNNVGTSFIYGGSFYYIENLENIIDVRIADYIGILQDKGASSVVIEFLEDMMNIKFVTMDFTYGELNYIINFIYSLLTGITRANPKDIVIIARAIIEKSGQQQPWTDEDIKSLVDAGANILEDINRSTNSFKYLAEVLDIISDNIYYEAGTYAMINSIFEFAKEAVKHIDIVIMVARNLDLAIAEIVYDWMYDLAYINIDNLIIDAKFIKPIAELTKTDESFGDALSNFLIDMNIIYNCNLTSSKMTCESLYDLVIELADKDLAKLTDEDKEKLKEEVYNKLHSSYLDFSSDGNIQLVSKEYIESEEFQEAFGDGSYTEDIDGLVVKFNLELNYDGNVGLHIMYITAIVMDGDKIVEKGTTKLAYFVYDETISFNLERLYNLERDLFIYEQNASSPYAAASIFNPYDQLRIDTYFDNTDLDRYLTNCIGSTLYISYKNYEFAINSSMLTPQLVVDTSKCGLVDGYIKYSGIVELYIPIQAYIVDPNNPVIDYNYIELSSNNYGNTIYREDKDEIIYLTTDKAENYSIDQVRIDQFIANFKDMGSINADATSTFNKDILGKQEVVISFTYEDITYNIKLNYYVYQESEYEYIKDIEVVNDYGTYGYYYTTNKENPLTDETPLVITTFNNDRIRLTYADLKEYVKNIYGDAASTEVSYIYHDNDSDFEAVITIVKDGKILASSEIRFRYTADNGVYFSLDYDKIIVDSLDDITLDYILNQIERITYTSSITFTYEVFYSNYVEEFSKLGIKISLENKYGYYYLCFTSEDYSISHSIDIYLNDPDYEGEINYVRFSSNTSHVYFLDTNTSLTLADLTDILSDYELRVTYSDDVNVILKGEDLINYLSTNASITNTNISDGYITLDIKGYLANLYLDNVICKDNVYNVDVYNNGDIVRVNIENEFNPYEIFKQGDFIFDIHTNRRNFYGISYNEYADFFNNYLVYVGPEELTLGSYSLEYTLFGISIYIEIEVYELSNITFDSNITVYFDENVDLTAITEHDIVEALKTNSNAWYVDDDNYFQLSYSDISELLENNNYTISIDDEVYDYDYRYATLTINNQTIRLYLCHYKPSISISGSRVEISYDKDGTMLQEPKYYYNLSNKYSSTKEAMTDAIYSISIRMGANEVYFNDYDDILEFIDTYGTIDGYNLTINYEGISKTFEFIRLNEIGITFKNSYFTEVPTTIDEFISHILYATTYIEGSYTYYTGEKLKELFKDAVICEVDESGFAVQVGYDRLYFNLY